MSDNHNAHNFTVSQIDVRVDFIPDGAYPNYIRFGKCVVDVSELFLRIDLPTKTVVYPMSRVRCFEYTTEADDVQA